jgi:hypothetical protein
MSNKFSVNTSGTVIGQCVGDNQHVSMSFNSEPEPTGATDKSSFPVSGIWLRRIGDEVHVLFEHEGHWYSGITEHVEGNFSHIMEPLSMRSRVTKRQFDPITEKAGE